MEEKKTRERQYQPHVDLRDTKGLITFGLRTNASWYEDPKRFLFVLARYKFAAKMLSGKSRVLEIGCGDAFGTRLVLQEVGSICAIDFDPVFVSDVNERMEERWKFECRVHDILAGPVDEQFDAAYSLDVIEHIQKADEQLFLSNITRSLDENGILIIGSPSVQSQIYASPGSLEGHVNCKDHKELKDLMLKYFHNVLMFSMNDEVVHTGFHKMAHYMIAIGIGKRKM